MLSVSNFTSEALNPYFAAAADFAKLSGFDASFKFVNTAIDENDHQIDIIIEGASSKSVASITVTTKGKIPFRMHCNLNLAAYIPGKHDFIEATITAPIAKFIIGKF